MITAPRKIYHHGNPFHFNLTVFHLLQYILILLLGTISGKHSGTLVKTIILFRHGARAPLNPYKFHGLPDTDETLWPEGYGNLLQTGKVQLFELGQHIRLRYINLLLPYNKTVAEDVRAVTTAADRCYQSAALLLAGLYLPSAEQKWSEELQWLPVPILYESADRIYIIGRRNMCPSYNDELLKNMPSINRTDIRYLLDFMSPHILPVKISTVTDLYFVADYFFTKLSLNLTLPDWLPENEYAKLEKFYVESFDYLTATIKLRRLLTGALITDIIQRIRELIYSDSKNSKIFLYSGHDSSLHSLGRTLGFEMKFVPGFGASFFFEIYKHSANDYNIKLFYSNDYSMNKLKMWTIPGCNEFCPVGKFVRLMDKFIVKNWSEECNVI